MKSIIYLGLIAMVTMFFSCKTEPDNGLIKVTSSSEKAVALFNDAYVAMSEIKLARFNEAINLALVEDPDFFMAKYLLYTYEVNFTGDSAAAMANAKAALDAKGKLSKGEKLLKELLEKKLEGDNAAVGEIAATIVELYPNDFWGYYELSDHQRIANDNAGRIATLKQATEKSNMKALAYNHLGYAFLSANDLDEAAMAFDKYIELEPELANPYDSKGDYFMAAGDYQNAYDSYMKANMIDTLWGVRKADKAKMMMDSLNNVNTQLVTNN